MSNKEKPENMLYNNNILKYEEFYLIKQNSVYKIIIGQLKNEILIKCKNYEIKINNNDLSILTKLTLKTINEAYQFIINIFKCNKAIIKDIIINQTINLLLTIYVFNIEKNIEISLEYKKNVNLIDNFMNINNEINTLKDEIKLLKNEINKLKKIHNIKESKINKNENINSIKLKNNYSNINPKNIEYLYDIVNDSYSNLLLSNTFSVFKSINDILYLIYSNENKSIILYNIINNKKIKELRNAHNKNITNIRYFLNKINKKDLIISISAYDNNIKLWNIHNDNFECLININNINENGFLYSACILNENNNNYIMTSNLAYYGNCDNIKVFDFNGNKIKEINNSNEMTYFIDILYDNKLKKNYILTGNKGFIKSYDYNKNDIYKIFSEFDNKGHFNIISYESCDIIKIIESSCDGNIRIWNFHSGELLNKIKVGNNNLREISIWDNEYIFVGCDDKTIKLIEIKNGKNIKELKAHNNEVICIKIITHPHYGKCLISQGANSDNIKLWVYKDN